MLRRKLTRSDWVIIITNLVPVFGVWFLGWSAVEAFIVYALETLILGMLTLLKMAVVSIARRKHDWENEGQTTKVSGWFFMLFFTVHYGIFAAVQNSIFAESAGITKPGGGMLHFFFYWYEYVNADIAAMLAVFVTSYLVRTFIPFIVQGEYKTISMMRVMFQPYGRIFVQQFTVILGSMFLGFGWQKGFILVFALVKIYMEVYIRLDEMLQKGLKAREETDKPTSIN